MKTKFQKFEKRQKKMKKISNIFFQIFKKNLSKKDIFSKKTLI